MGNNTYLNHEKAEDWLNQVAAEKQSGAAFDDASGIWANAPDNVRELADTLKTDGTAYPSGRALIAAVMDSTSKQFEMEHGRPLDGAVLDSAFSNALRTISPQALQAAGIPSSVLASMDDASSTQSGAPMATNRAVLALHSSIIDIVPFAGQIPMSDGLEGRILIAQHEAASKTGAYQPNQSMDGIFAGQPFMSAMRSAEATDSGSSRTTYTAKILYADGDSNGSPVIAGSTEVFVNGLPAGRVPVEAAQGDAQAQIAGSVVLPDGSGGEQRHTVTGTLTVASGEVSLTFSPALPAGATVHVESALNYEHSSLKDKRPVVQTAVRSFPLRAHFASGISQLTQEAKTQLMVEARLDPSSESMLALRQQHAAEKHLSALRSMYRIAQSHKHSANMNSPTRQDERSRESMWKDILFTLTQADVDMMSRTNAFGIGVIYVGNKGRAELSALPEEVFQRSGLPSRPGIYRLGRLFSQFEVYFVPNLLKETANSLEMLAIGRSEQVGLNPYVVGDVVGATFHRLGTTINLTEGEGYFYAGAAKVNPYQKAASGAALIAVTGL